MEEMEMSETTKDEDTLVNTMDTAEESTKEEDNVSHIRKYASTVMAESIVTGVANIIKTENKYRKYGKLSVLLICILGFIYQASTFIVIFLSHPTVVDIYVVKRAQVVAPAYTYCNANGIKRTKFCAKYPNRCYTPENITEYCRTFHEFCSYLTDTRNFSVVKSEYFSFEHEISFEELKELGHDVNTLRAKVHHNWAENADAVGDDELEEGPLMIRRENHILILCYTKYVRADSNKMPRYTPEKRRYHHQVLDEYEFNLEPDEVFNPERPPAGFFSLHSPFEIPLPSHQGEFIKPKHFYLLHLRLEQDYLLPHPYGSDCVNYTEIWEENGRKGPRSKEMCIEKCKLNGILELCGCTFPGFMYPYTSYCNKSTYILCMQNDELRNEVRNELEDCSSKCKDDCTKVKYKVTVTSRRTEFEMHRNKSVDFDSNRARVRVAIFDEKVMEYHFKPQYQNIEVLSYIGGFIGAWLGIPIIALADLLESIIMIILFIFRHRRREHEQSPDI